MGGAEGARGGGAKDEVRKAGKPDHKGPLTQRKKGALEGLEQRANVT